MERSILHCDMNNFYASVECILNEDYKGKALAVCGREDDRQGIVLAKSEIAKSMGVKTGDTVWQARKKCPDLIVVTPKFDEYAKYSKLAQKIYYRYTELVEPFGLDECWLDVTNSKKLFGSGVEIAEKIKEDIKRELGLTISVGVSFNKIFAKLGSDMKKPDAITVIPKETFREVIWHLKANEIIGIGKATYQKLLKYNIKTIGDIAEKKPELLKHILGKNGLVIWEYANGKDTSKVRDYTHHTTQKSISNGITATKDLISSYEVYKVILKLSQDVARRLREQGIYAKGVKLSIKDNELFTREYQKSLSYTVQGFNEITQECYDLFTKNYKWVKNVRAVSVSAIELCESESFAQISLFEDVSKNDNKQKLEQTMEKIRQKYGNSSIEIASLTGDIKISKEKTTVKVLPSAMHK